MVMLRLMEMSAASQLLARPKRFRGLWSAENSCLGPTLGYNKKQRFPGPSHYPNKTGNPATRILGCNNPCLSWNLEAPGSSFGSLVGENLDGRVEPLFRTGGHFVVNSPGGVPLAVGETWASSSQTWKNHFPPNVLR